MERNETKRLSAGRKGGRSLIWKEKEKEKEKLRDILFLDGRD
jgi:hypothetical protein